MRSVVGFGGRLPSGDIFAVILFCRVSVPSETAELFPPLALNTLAACLHVDPEATFREEARSGAPGPRSFESQTYEDLLRVQDSILLSQWARLAATEEERDAYEAGQREVEAQGSPLFHMLSPDERPSDEDAAAAYDKGLRGEPLDEDKSE